MSAASHAASPVRRPAAPPQAARPAGRSAADFNFSASSGDDVMRINLQDIPRLDQSMDVEGFKPSLLSRLLDMVAPLKRR